MAVFESPRPIAVRLDNIVGSVRLVASDRTDTVVEVTPRSDREADKRAHAQVQVEYGDGRLTVRAPKRLGLFNPPGHVVVEIQLPTGSAVSCSVAADVTARGELGAVRLANAGSDIRLDRTAAVSISVASGDVVIDHVSGDAKIESASGRVSLGELHGNGTCKSASGDTAVGVLDGELVVRTASGRVTVDRLEGAVSVKSASGGLRVGAAVRGKVAFQSASGGLEVGVPSGTAALLEVTSVGGRVDSELDAADGPDPADKTVEIHGTTASGKIAIRRAAGSFTK